LRYQLVLSPLAALLRLRTTSFCRSPGLAEKANLAKEELQQESSGLAGKESDAKEGDDEAGSLARWSGLSWPGISLLGIQV
jgi:hypothetical protein